MEDRVEVTPPEGSSTGHTRVKVWGGDHEHARFIQVDARRVNNAGNDEAQVEVMIMQSRRYKGARLTTVSGSMVLSPDEARMLALAICPELAQ